LVPYCSAPISSSATSRSSLETAIPHEAACPGAAGASGGGKARLGAFSDKAAFELGQRAKHVKHQTSLRSRRVEGFGQAAKADAA
jgi:hypothetical protein